MLQGRSRRYDSPKAERGLKERKDAGSFSEEKRTTVCPSQYDTVFWTQIPSVKDFMRAYVALRGFTRLCACLHGHALHCAPLIVLAVSCTSQCLRRVNSYRLPAKSIYFHLLAFARSCSHFCICNRILTTRKTSQDRARPHLTLTT